MHSGTLGKTAISHIVPGTLGDCGLTFQTPAAATPHLRTMNAESQWRPAWPLWGCTRFGFGGLSGSGFRVEGPGLRLLCIRVWVQGCLVPSFVEVLGTRICGI